MIQTVNRRYRKEIGLEQRKRTAKPSERWEGAFWQNKQRATNSITFLISGTTSTYGRRKGTRTNLTDTTMQTNTQPLKSRSDAVDRGWIFVCPEPLLPAHGLTATAPIVAGRLAGKVRPTTNGRH